MTSRALLLFLGVLVLTGLQPGCQTANPWAEAYSPADFNAALAPVAASRVINVGHVDPAEVAARDFAGAQLLGTARWRGMKPAEADAVAHGRSVGADLVLLRKRYAGSTSQTTYAPRPAYGAGHTSVLVQNADGSRTRVTSHPPPVLYPTTRTRREYRFDAVFLRTPEAVPGAAVR